MSDAALSRIRREPPPFRRAEVARIVHRTPHLVRLALTGAELAGLDIGLPAASVRLLVPPDGATELVLPTWNGNEFLQEDGSRPAIRTLTPLRFDADARQLEVEVVLHGAGPLSAWVEAVQAGAATAISGTGRGYAIDPAAVSFLLAGDESALPAIGVLLEALPAAATVLVLVEVREPDAELALPAHPGATVRWLARAAGTTPGDALVAAVVATELAPGTRIWAAGEAAAMQRLRRHLMEDRGWDRTLTTVRGYWKVGRGGDTVDAG